MRNSNPPWSNCVVSLSLFLFEVAKFAFSCRVMTSISAPFSPLLGARSRDSRPAQSLNLVVRVRRPYFRRWSCGDSLLIIFEITISGLEFGSIWLIWEKEKPNITFLCYIVLYIFPFSNVKIYATVHRWSNRPKPVKFKS